MTQTYTGADLISDFIAKFLFPKVFLVTGGACAFMVDAIGRHKAVEYACFQHEQSAAMAADAVWRVNGQVGVTMATSGPGATNLITGIACSWFDSIPSFHFTGQVNQEESSDHHGWKVRQAGFQETNIVNMVSGITKFARKVDSVTDLADSLWEALVSSLQGRMGPVLIDVPMNIQKAKVSEETRTSLLNKDISQIRNSRFKIQKTSKQILSDFLITSKRPLIIIGGGAHLSGTSHLIQKWCEKNNLPFATSWAALSGVHRSSQMYAGSIGVYGSRLANRIVQAADSIVVFGSRLDNRQRSGNPKAFAPFARKLVFDIDEEELRKYENDSTYEGHLFDLREIEQLIEDLEVPSFESWQNDINHARKHVSSGFDAATPTGGLNPYSAVQTVQKLLPDDSILISDCGANLCWVYQGLLPNSQEIFTAGGNSPMGYSLPAAIGAKFTKPKKTIACFIGDGGLQMNIQELQTIIYYNLPIQLFIQNNGGYGIIKQFQDSYFEGRHFASGDGYSYPNFGKVVTAYGLNYFECRSEEDIRKLKLDFSKPNVIDLILPTDSLITPKLEVNKFLHNQFPYLDEDTKFLLPYEYPDSPSDF